MNMHPGLPQRVQIDELLVGGNDKGGANLDTALWKERPIRVTVNMDGGHTAKVEGLGPPGKKLY